MALHTTFFPEKEKSASFLSIRHRRIFTAREAIDRCSHESEAKLEFSHCLAKHRERNRVVRTQLGKSGAKLATIRFVRIQPSRQDIAYWLIAEFVKSSTGPLYSHGWGKWHTGSPDRRHIEL